MFLNEYICPECGEPLGYGNDMLAEIYPKKEKKG